MYKNLLNYKKLSLKKTLNLSGNFNQEDMKIIVECIKKANINASNSKFYTKEELYLLGLSPFEIHRYFVPVDNFQWKLKKLIIINDNVIESFDELKKELNLKIAS